MSLVHKFEDNPVILPPCTSEDSQTDDAVENHDGCGMKFQQVRFSEKIEIIYITYDEERGSNDNENTSTDDNPHLWKDILMAKFRAQDESVEKKSKEDLRYDFYPMGNRGHNENDTASFNHDSESGEDENLSDDQ